MPTSKDHKTFSNFLQAQTEQVKSLYLKDRIPDHPLDFKLILGNEAGDADSIISALAYGHVLSLSSSSTPNSSTVLVPLASIPRQDIKLRNDVLLLLGFVGIHPADERDILCIDDDIVHTLIHSAGTRNITKSIVLVDHNKLKRELWHLNGQVTEILDHHQDEGAHMESVSPEWRQIAFEHSSATVGSTCTLIVEKWRRWYEHENIIGSNPYLDPGVGLALLGVILLDTMNMSKQAGKGTERDQKAIDFLMKHVVWKDLLWTCKEEEVQSKLFTSNNQDQQSVSIHLSGLFQWLQESKFDPVFWNHLSPHDTLRIDYKKFESKQTDRDEFSFGLSSVLLSMEDLLSKPNFFPEAVEYMKDVNVTLLGVLTMTIVDDKPKREILLLGNSTIVEGMTFHILHSETASALNAKLERKSKLSSDVEEETYMAVLTQGNSKASRKQVAPIMFAYFENHSN